MEYITDILLSLILISLGIHIYLKIKSDNIFLSSSEKIYELLKTINKDVASKIEFENDKIQNALKTLEINTSAQIEKTGQEIINNNDRQSDKLMNALDTGSKKLIDTLNEVTRLD